MASKGSRAQQVEVPFRTIRIGTLKAFPIPLDENDVSPHAKNTAPLILNESGVTFSFTIDGEYEPEKKLTIKISARRLERVECYVLRGCPVIWLTTDEKMARKIRSVCNMVDRNGFYYDPSSAVKGERHIAAITQQDPLPYTMGHSIQNIFKQLFRNQNKKVDSHFRIISQKHCNTKLVQCSTSMDEVKRKQLIYEQLQKRSKQKQITDDSNSSDSCDDEPDKVTPVGSSSNNSATSSNPPVPSTPPKAVVEKEVLSSSGKTVIESSPTTSPSVDHKKVHRARKSIPDRHRVVSIESQLRARVEEQQQEHNLPIIATQGVNSTATVETNNSGESESSDTGRISGGESPSAEQLAHKKKRPKDPFLWTGRKRKRKSSSNCSSPTPVEEKKAMEQTNHETSEFTPDVTETSVKNKTELRTMMLEGNMATLRQDFNNYLHQTPLCTCVVISPHTINFEKANGIKCMAIDNICGRIYGCDEPISHREMMRPSSKVPVIGMCDEHKERMIRHECCPGCGTFCSGGNILVCIKNDDCPHRFHRDCMVLGGQLSECPHCGGDTTSVREVNLTPNMDKDMLMILAGKDPVKMKMKTFLQTRGEKNARMGHVMKKTGYKPVRVPGVTMKFNDLTFDSSKLMIGHERDEFENLLQSLQHEPPQKVRFQAKSFLQFARQNDILKMIQMLSEGCDSSTRGEVLNKSLHESLPDSKISTIHFLVECGADINARDEEGNTPLIRAILMKKKELLVYLLLNNADVTIKDEEMGMPCIHHAAKEGYVEGCYLLMIYGRAKINSLDEGGWTPLVWAAEHKHTSMAKFLLHYGADVKIIDKEGNTCLLWAALSGNVDIMKMCLDNNTPVDHFNTHGDTALHIAARQDNYNCVFTLLANAANPNIKNSEGETPIECAPERSMCWIALKIHLCIRNAGLFRKVILPYNRERVLNPDISRGYDKLPIICVNARDDAPCPTNPPHGFHYVTENVHTSQDTRINVVISGMQSCQCSDNCGSPSCVCGLISERCWYGNDGTLLPEFDILEPPLIYECNQMCRCSRQCKNRVVQNGIRYRLQVYRTQGMGWGLVALEAMPRGAFVCEYVGELISDDEADQREDDSYLFDLENKDGEIYCIDARNYGNVSRFINHLCEPNLIPIRVFVGHHDIRFPILAYFTTREIQAGEELGFDYGERFWDVKCRQFTCQCGSPVCKYSSEVYKNKAEQELQQHNENNDVTNNVEMKTSSAINEIVD